MLNDSQITQQNLHISQILDDLNQKQGHRLLHMFLDIFEAELFNNSSLSSLLPVISTKIQKKCICRLNMISKMENLYKQKTQASLPIAISNNLSLIVCYLLLSIFLPVTGQPFSQTTTISNLNIETTSHSDSTYEPHFPPFSQYVIDFNKNYESGSLEYRFREDTYYDRVNFWRNMYITGQLSFFVGPNERTDWTEQERIDSKPSQAPQLEGEEDHIPLMKVSQSAGNPTKLDWRDKKVISSIKSQGKCGSCWTFATAAYGQSRLIMKGEKQKDIDLSEQYLLTCTSECDCGGGFLQYVFEKAAEGVPEERYFPYNPYGAQSPFICSPGDKKIMFGYEPQKAYNLTDTEIESLLQQGPLVISISAVDWQDYKGGIFKCQPGDPVNHAVLLVGYDESSWIVKNQWGKNWGQKGYIRVSKNHLNNCKVGASAFWMWENFHSALLWGIIGLLVMSY